ncbi:ribosomal RNA-processing protein 17 [Heracleum sosnowskyi]|uniref:Ribosomal RNA-processing protein 17 n=1 Tax=Heracleum sosnowskyi TaxID=360622 RepID=A0AAD8HYM9_9APIA|nr:ribosomal RNA-processing protein 17 [Heracleum sosnowskyi]
MEEAVEDGINPHIRANHIKKRALKNKSLSVSFNEKDLNDYVTGFHKRKKKRRKEGQLQQQEAERRKRIEKRKQRKLERDFVQNGEAPPTTDEIPVEGEEEDEEEEINEIATVSGTTMYDNGDVKVMVTTSEINGEEEELKSEKMEKDVTRLATGSKEKQQKIPVTKKKPFKRVGKKKSRPKPQSKRDKRKGKIQSTKR